MEIKGGLNNDYSLTSSHNQTGMKRILRESPHCQNLKKPLYLKQMLRRFSREASDTYLRRLHPGIRNRRLIL